MDRAFVDASMLFAAAYSASGASRELVRLAVRNQVELVLSEDIVEEALRNILSKAKRAEALLRFIVEETPFRYVEPDSNEVENARAYVAKKDAFVLAGAILSSSATILSFDRLHLVGNSRIVEAFGISCITPGDFLAWLHSAN